MEKDKEVDGIMPEITVREEGANRAKASVESVRAPLTHIDAIVQITT